MSAQFRVNTTTEEFVVRSLTIIAFMSLLTGAGSSKAQDVDLSKAGPPVTLGQQLETCITANLSKAVMMRRAQYGNPRSEPDMLVHYEERKNIVHIMVLGSQASADEAKKRLLDRAWHIEFARKKCADLFVLSKEQFFSIVDIIYMKNDMNTGDQKAILRIHKDKIEML